MYCENCGTKVEEDDMYCPNCGEIISVNYKESNAGFKIPAGILVISAVLVIIFGVIFGVSNYITTKKQATETYVDIQDVSDNYSEETSGFDIYTATEDNTTDMDSTETMALQRVYDFVGVLNETDKKQLELEYSQISEQWNCNFAIFFLNNTDDKTEAEIFEILEHSDSDWDSSIPNIVYVYGVLNGARNTYSSNSSPDMLGMYTQEYISCNSLIYYVPEESVDFYLTGAALLSPFSQIHENIDASYTFCEEDLSEVEAECKRNLAYKDYRLLLEGIIGTEILENCEIESFALVDMNTDGLEELVVEVSSMDVMWCYIFQWENYEFLSWKEVSCEMSPLYIKEDNTLIAYWLEEEIIYPYHYVLTDIGIEIKEDEPGIQYGEEEPLKVIPYNLLYMLDNTEENRYTYLTTGLDF